jgi:ketosteroid isomerase-like protein
MYMPQPPQVGLLTRYVLENPYPLGLLLLALAVGFAWTGLRSGHRQRLPIAGILAAVGVAVLLTGALVVTSGERARRVTLALVDAAVAADVSGAAAMFADDATLSLGSPANPAFPRDDIERRIENLDGKYRIEFNQVTMLQSYTEARDRATVHLGCRTTLRRGFGPTPTRWVLRIERQADGTWKVARVTWISIAGHSPASDLGL